MGKIMEGNEYYKNLGKIIFSKETIQARVKVLANKINQDFKNKEILFNL